MENKITISYFKTHCLKIFDDIQKTHQTITVTKRDKPIAKIEPINHKSSSLFGLFKNKAEIKSDIISIDDKWDAEHE